jgi:hypothetical protein
MEHRTGWIGASSGQLEVPISLPKEQPNPRLITIGGLLHHTSPGNDVKELAMRLKSESQATKPLSGSVACLA